MRANITSDGLKEAEQQLGKLVVRDRNLLHHQEVRDEIETSTQRRFNRGVRRAGRAWRVEKARRGLSQEPMRATGQAFRALTTGTGPRASAVQFKRVYGGVVFGVKPGRSDLHYMQVHASGYSSRGGRVKPRRVVVVDKVANANIAAFVLERITEDRIR